MKNLLKIFVIFAFILIIPIITISLIAVWFEDGCPVIFIQKRLGKNKRHFYLYKIRTMYKSAPNDGTHHVEKTHHLKFGAILRKLKIDELPQLINYLKGDILLVGPRPGLLNQKDLETYRDIYNVFDIKPGITGLAQVLGYDMSNPELLALIDNLYIKERTIKLDIMIFFATFFSKIKMKLNKKYSCSIEKFINDLNHV